MPIIASEPVWLHLEKISSCNTFGHWQCESMLSKLTAMDRQNLLTLSQNKLVCLPLKPTPSSPSDEYFSLVAKLSQIPSISKQLPCALPNQYEALGMKEKLHSVVPPQEEQHPPVEIVVGAAYM